ncbi:hypothetical protein BKI52_43585 [marine bacterium AO1-C]|nr:hypothetical protein BKI52_43585 [marine bacterium AO1-C]
MTAQTLLQMLEKTIQLSTRKAQVNYYEYGTGDKTLLFIPGWCINKTYWEKQCAFFAQKNYRVIAIDLPGFGASTASRENWSIQAYAQDVEAFIEVLQLEEVILVAHSMAGDVMLQVASSANVSIKGLIGIDNFKFVDVVFTPEQQQEMATYLDGFIADFKNTSQAYADRFLFHPETPIEVREQVKQDFANAQPNVALSALTSMWQFAAQVNEKLESLPQKLYLLNNDLPPTNEQGLMKHCKSDCEVTYLSATGHYPMLEKPNEFNMKLEELLEKIH